MNELFKTGFPHFRESAFFNLVRLVQDSHSHSNYAFVLDHENSLESEPGHFKENRAWPNSRQLNLFLGIEELVDLLLQELDLCVVLLYKGLLPSLQVVNLLAEIKDLGFS